jgi:hypothetical protein
MGEEAFLDSVLARWLKADWQACPDMSDASRQLADKLLSEGNKTLAFFRGLPESAWSKQVFEDGAMWKVRDIFEHLCISEHSLRRLFENILATGQGAPEGYDVNAFNKEKTGRFASLSRDELFALYDETRRKTAEFTRGLTDERLAIRARHPAMGDASLEEMLKMVYLHHALHVRDVKRLI